MPVMQKYCANLPTTLVLRLRGRGRLPREQRLSCLCPQTSSVPACRHRQSTDPSPGTGPAGWLERLASIHLVLLMVLPAPGIRILDDDIDRLLGLNLLNLLLVSSLLSQIGIGDRLVLERL